ncbi:SNARE associated Golgi family protein [Clavispora lusitaniae]|uniref:SNARE associated Golgi family protein n=1 Tax=Clavispora lusitaniae TaxID=36911 RepID=UPI00202BE82C|nr:SNARE associated Golgi family protein [Clavispora lusitaniae]
MPRLNSTSDPAMSSGFMSQIRDLATKQNETMNDFRNRVSSWYFSHPLWKRVLLALGGIAIACVGILALIFHKRVIKLLVDVSDYWENLRFGRTILFFLIFFVGFPPLIGYSALSMLCGMVFGFPGGWPLLASATILGSLASFLVFKYVLRSQGERLVQHNEKFRAFAEILKEDASLFLLVLLRLCPFPYSLSNGALAAIPNLPVSTYVLASIITSPKMFVHVFVGNTIKHLGDEERSFSAKVIDVVSIVITGCALSLASYIIYNRMQGKLNSYHHGLRSNYDDLVFGNFNDDLELDRSMGLEAGDFDEDNFFIGDDEEDTGDSRQLKGASPKITSKPIEDEDNGSLGSLGRPKVSRDY